VRHDHHQHHAQQQRRQQQQQQQQQQHADVILMSDVVYGSDPSLWEKLVATLAGACSPDTLVVQAETRRVEGVLYPQVRHGVKGGGMCMRLSGLSCGGCASAFAHVRASVSQHAGLCRFCAGRSLRGPLVGVWCCHS
jgi:hypothetical protein